MTWLAPSERTNSRFRVLQTPVTSAPSDLAIWTANVPTQPDAPLTRTVLPGPTCDLREGIVDLVLGEIENAPRGVDWKWIEELLRTLREVSFSADLTHHAYHALDSHTPASRSGR